MSRARHCPKGWAYSSTRGKQVSGSTELMSGVSRCPQQVERVPSSGRHNRTPQTGARTHIHFFQLPVEAGQLEMEVLEILVLGDRPLPGLQRATFPLCPHIP